MWNLMKSSAEKMWLLFCTLFLITVHNEALAKRKVCVIGAGRVGLGALKKVADQTDKFEPIAFERNSDIGGLWIYREDPELDEHGLPAHSGIYKNLKTITHKDIMIYPDYPAFENNDDSGFTSHETFLNYMRSYADHFGLRKYIQLNTLVTNVTPLKDKCTHGTTRWNIKIRDLKTDKDDVILCDVVMVCNGRFSKPNIPKIPGIETFHGKVLHSRSYRIPQDFANKTVLILGAQASGAGIARDLSAFAKTVYLSRRQTHYINSNGFPKNVIIVNGVVKANGSELTLEDDSNIKTDAFIFCTGYIYDFPFLDENSGIKFDEHNLFGLRRSFINKKYPSMALIGLGNDNAYAIYYYEEATYFLKSL